MKTKKIAFVGLMAPMLVSSVAFAETTDASLTTKGYVDEGLEFVYRHGEETYATQESVTNLASDIEAMEYSGATGGGITVNNTNHEIGLTAPANPAADTSYSYVYNANSATWAPVQIETSWSSSAFMQRFETQEP